MNERSIIKEVPYDIRCSAGASSFSAFVQYVLDEVMENFSHILSDDLENTKTDLVDFGFADEFMLIGNSTAHLRRIINPLETTLEYLYKYPPLLEASKIQYHLE